MTVASKDMRNQRRFFSGRIALAIALASGTVLGVTALEAPAHAQKKKKKQKAGKADYSDAFKAVYPAMAEKVKGDAPDYAALKAEVPALSAASTTNDDKFAAGNLIFSIGQKSSDPAIQLAGMNMMLESGKVPAEQLGPYSFAGGQLAYQANNFELARQRFQQASDAGYTDTDPQPMIAEMYFAEDNHAAGVDYIKQIVAQRLAAGQPTDPVLIERGLAMAYNNKLNGRAMDMAVLFVSEHPSAKSWDLGITSALSAARFEKEEILDLLRLARRTDSMKEIFYKEYVDSADPRRLPGEVAAVISEGIASGALDSTDSFIAESRDIASRQISADKSELPTLERDANKSGAQLRTVVAAANVLLSYGEHAKAEPLYAKALNLPGVDTGAIMTRLGISQLEQGKYNEAQATFAKVQGNRRPIARLWEALAKGEAGSAMPSAAATLTEANPET